MTTASLRTLTRGYRRDFVSIMRLSCSTVSTLVVERTPRKSGSARLSWNPTNGKPQVRNIVVSVDNPNQSRNNISKVVNSLKPGDFYSLANGLPYITPLEYGGSRQARNPEGMVRRTVAEWDAIVESEVGKLR